MLKKILTVVAMLYAAACFAAVDVNKASAAELDGIKGIGPGISTKILDERKKGNFKDWNDLVDRVQGVGDVNAAKFSAEGMTVNGESFKGVAPAAKKADAKKTATSKEVKTDAKTATAPVAPAAAAPAAPAADAKAQAAADKEAAKKAKAEEKAAKAEEAKKAKEAKAAAKDVKADAAKPAASAAKK